jgi:ATP-dependent DNA helicase RecQ
MRRVTRVERTRRRRSSAGDASLDAGGNALLDRLKAWRLGESRAQAVPAYVILHDKTLVDIAKMRPRTLDALGAIAGIGARKLERYGDALIGVVDA